MFMVTGDGNESVRILKNMNKQQILEDEAYSKAIDEQPASVGGMLDNEILFPIDELQIEKRRQEMEEIRRLNREALLKELVRYEFLQPIDRSIKTVDWTAFDEVQAWDGKKSITVRGISGLGKSRAIYEVLKREFVENERDFTVVSESQLLSRISSAMMTGKLEKLERSWCSKDILFFDDIDKVNFSTGVTGENAMTILFGVIKARQESRKPTILAYNLTLAEVFKKAGAHVLESLKRRIQDKQHWMSVEFRKGEL